MADAILALLKRYSLNNIWRFGLSIMLAFILRPLSAQETKNPELDNHRYFKEIGLGDSVDKWKKHLTKVDSSSVVHEYLFDLRHCCDKVFDRDVQYLLVLSKENKIVSLKIYLVDFLNGKDMKTIPEIKVALSEMIQSHLKLVNEFKNQFGVCSASRANEGDLVKIGKEAMSIHQWKGKSTLLTMELYMTEATYGNERDPITGFSKMKTPNRESTVIALTDLNFLDAEKKAGF